MILLVTTSSRAKECAAAVEQGTGHKTHVASTVPQAVGRLEAAEYDAWLSISRCWRPTCAASTRC